jgi:hypothetical protein
MKAARPTRRKVIAPPVPPEVEQPPRVVPGSLEAGCEGSEGVPGSLGG